MVELMVVSAILALLAALLLPAIKQARATARLGVCTSTLRGILQANAMYADDYQGYPMHGIDMEGFSWPATGHGRHFYPTPIFDDDWWDSEPGTEGRNKQGGGQNICNVGQLLWNRYLPEDAGAVACPQADYREDKGFYYMNVMLASYRLPFPPGMSGNCTAQNLKANWRADSFNGTPSYAYYRTTYVVRGPLIKLGEVDASRYAFLADHEAARQELIPQLSTGDSPLLGWSRLHSPGLNTGYLDGHVRMFVDVDRRITYWAGQARYYGNGYALFAGAYDE